MKIGKDELVAAIAEKLGTSKANAANVLGAVFTVVEEKLVEGHDVGVHNFGTFKVKRRAARKGFNPATQQPIDIAASSTVAFKPASKVTAQIKA